MRSNGSQVKVAVDVGGTFTDICVFDEVSHELTVAKVPTAPDPIDGLVAAIERTNTPWESISLLAHGTTVATNALVTRNLARTVMVTTRGFRDIIELRNGTREHIWDLFKDPAPPYVRRRERLEISERVSAAAEVLEPVDEAEARTLAGRVRELDAQSVAVCFMNSYVNPANEQAMKRILEEEAPGIFVCTSSEVLPEIFEHPRFSTTVVNAVLAPLVSSYVDRLADKLAARNYRGDPLLLHSGGGVMTTQAARQLPIRLASSGIAAGAIASHRIADGAGYKRAIGLDMGGTSTDISLAYDGEVQVTKQWFVEWGHPICLPSIDVTTIGAGGGSLAWIDEGGSLKNGPQSAGSVPGPACYGLGNELPTNTDANLVLNRLGDELVGGDVVLDRSAAETAIDGHIADPLGMALHEAARAIIQVANANMGDAVRRISIQKGYDPRDFVLVAFGGAGPLHGAAVARDLAIPAVLVPSYPGITSAVGCLFVDIRHDFAAMFFSLVDDADRGELEAQFARLETEARARLKNDGVKEENVKLQRSMDMRYAGQWRSLSVNIPERLESLDGPASRFHDEHEREYRYRRDDAAIEIYRLNVSATGVVEKAELREATEICAGAPPPPKSQRPVYFDEVDEPVATPVYDRPTLRPGTESTGPAIIEQLDSTTVVPPGVSWRVDRKFNIRIDLDGGQT